MAIEKYFPTANVMRDGWPEERELKIKGCPITYIKGVLVKQKIKRKKRR